MDTVCAPVSSQDYVLHTFDLYLAAPGDPWVDVGSIRAGSIKESLEISRVFNPTEESSPRLFALRTAATIDAEIDSVTAANLGKMIDEQPVSTVAGMVIDFTIGGLRRVWRTMLVHQFVGSGALLIVYFWRASVESETQLGFEDDWGALPMTLTSLPDWAHQDNPYGYMLLGDTLPAS